MPNAGVSRMVVLVGMLVVGPLAGCVGPDAATTDSMPPTGLEGLMGNVVLLDEGGFMMDVPVEIYLLGFGPEVADALQGKLKPEPVEHATINYDLAFPPAPDRIPARQQESAAPGRATAQFVVRDLDAAVDAAFLEAAADWKVADGQMGMLDANAAEAWIAAQLELERGAALDRAAPVFVILHAGYLGEHAWRYTFAKGYLEPIRIFGELRPVTIFDVSAAPDPYVSNGRPPDSVLRIATTTLNPPPYPTHSYDTPIGASGDEVVAVLAELSIDTAHHRFLKGPIYPISTKPCHHLSLVLGVHQTALTENLPDHKRAADYVNVAGLKGAFENLTGDDVTVELKTLMLPADDPVLDALSRQAGALATLDPLRWHFDENWEKYVTPSDGCEEYLSMLLFSDPTSDTRQYNGIGMYDVDRSHRISFSIVTDLTRLRKEMDGPSSTADPSEDWDVVNFLFSHETGHLFGQQHPHYRAKVDGDWSVNLSFDAVYSSMGYQAGSRTIDFGAVDFATWTRGRVGYTIAEAQALGLTGTLEFEQAMQHLEMGHWTAAHQALEPLLHKTAATEAGAKLVPRFQFWDHHAHA